MHARLKALLLRRANRQDVLPLINPTTGEVAVTSTDLGEKLSECIAALDCPRAEAERLRLQYLKDRA